MQVSFTLQTGLISFFFFNFIFWVNKEGGKKKKGASGSMLFCLGVDAEENSGLIVTLD